jgi:hypothetical protein
VGACGMQFAQQVPVARQQDSFFSMSEPHQGGISQCRVVAGVEAEYAQPAGKTAEHGISGETWRGHLFSMPVVLAIPELDKVPVFTLHKLSLDLMSILNAKLQRWRKFPWTNTLPRTDSRFVPFNYCGILFSNEQLDG